MPPSALLLALAPTLAAPPRPLPVDDGSIADRCQWPTVVSYRAGEEKCSGLLVHPEVILTAAHCIAEVPAGSIRFGERFQPAAKIVDAERCGIHPDFAETGAPSSDLGWCTLVEPVAGIPPTPLLTACETPWVQQGTPAVLVGFGITQDDDAFGTKRYAFTRLDSDLRADGTVWVGDAEVNGCFGDSGGPAFVQSPAGTWHALGLLTHGPDCGQGPVLYRSLVDRFAWLEAETGRDLSPCHDAEGQWDPGPDCGSIATEPLALGGSWPDLCAGERAPAPACPASPEADGETTTDDGTVPPLEELPPLQGDAVAEGCGCRSATPPLPAWWCALLLVRARSRRRRCPRPRR